MFLQKMSRTLALLNSIQFFYLVKNNNIKLSCLRNMLASEHQSSKHLKTGSSRNGGFWTPFCFLCQAVVDWAGLVIRCRGK